MFGGHNLLWRYYHPSPKHQTPSEMQHYLCYIMSWLSCFCSWCLFLFHNFHHHCNNFSLRYRDYPCSKCFAYQQAYLIDFFLRATFFSSTPSFGIYTVPLCITPNPFSSSCYLLLFLLLLIFYFITYHHGPIGRLRPSIKVKFGP